MHNFAWFLILAIFAVVLFGFSLWKSGLPRSRVLFVFFTISGLSYIFEYIILILFHSYNYFPNVIVNHWKDSVLGSAVSQAIVVPVIAMCIVALQLNMYWILGFCFLLMGIEEFFLWLGIYEHQWWKTGYTGVLLFIGFYIGKWWGNLLVKRKHWVDWLNIYFILSLVNHTISNFALVIFEVFLFSPGWFSDRVRDSLALEGLFWFIHSIPVSFLIQWWFKWYSLLLLYIVDWGIFRLLELLDLIQFNDYWNATLCACFPILIVLLTFGTYRKLVRGLPEGEK